MLLGGGNVQADLLRKLQFAMKRMRWEGIPGREIRMTKGRRVWKNRMGRELG